MERINFPYRRIVVVGTTSSGKSTLAQRIAARHGYRFIELDALFWGPQWTPASDTDFRTSVDAITCLDQWVVAGNYHAVRDLVWPRAQAILWLDYPFPVVFWRLLVRTIRRGLTQEELWNGNRETFWRHLKIWSDESLFRWLFKSFWRRRKETPILLALPEHRHLKVIRLKTPREAERWLESVGSNSAVSSTEGY
jgi:adenylate kinase family enzyme